jgi:N-acetyl sugar amidotransferase
MKYCVKCLQPNTRPGGGSFNRFGICVACNYYANSLKDDWDDRFNVLNSIIKDNRKNNKSLYDCIIGVSGGKDSTRQALWVRDKLNLNPLLVCLSYPPDQITQRGADNISNLINLGFDTEIISLAPVTWKKILKYSFLKYGNWAKASEQALVSAVPRIAIYYGIKLIFWGENPGLQLGDLNTISKNGYDGNNLHKMNTVKSGKIDWLINIGFKKNKIFNYEFPKKNIFISNNLKIIYLGWFWRDWSLKGNGLSSILSGLEIRDDNFKNTQDIYGVTSLDEDWVIINQMIKFYKYGFGRVTDYLNEEIRLGSISRLEAITIADKFDGACSEKYIKSFCTYLDISKDFFWKKVKYFVNKKLFTVSKKKIIKKFRVGYGI